MKVVVSLGFVTQLEASASDAAAEKAKSFGFDFLDKEKILDKLRSALLPVLTKAVEGVVGNPLLKMIGVTVVATKSELKLAVKEES